jgi:hypothetical protein
VSAQWSRVSAVREGAVGGEGGEGACGGGMCVDGNALAALTQMTA